VTAPPHASGTAVPEDATAGLPVAQSEALRAAYAAPPRAYHHFGHVIETLAHFRSVVEGPGWQAPDAVRFALLYHDAVYVPGRKDNEARSADLAREHLRRWPPVADVDIDRVQALILLTARHGGLHGGDFPDSPEGEDTRRFLDCDMAILGAAPEAFADYDRAIAEEYRAVPRWLYRRKRCAFFRMLLDSERIFLSAFFRDRFEAQARRNLETMLAGGGKIAG
jgi:predicted metal-dependent HD superfamily phosphohydrolase